MARQLRVHPPGGIHHITARGNNRVPIFLCDADRVSMLAIVEEAIERHRCRLLAFCLMDNHVHFTVQDLDGVLSKALKHINGVYAQRFNRRHGRTGHLFGGRFWNSLIETDSYLATAVEYVHLNPAKAGIVTCPAEYRWSSYRSYVGLERPWSFLSMDLVLGLYGDDRKLLRFSTERVERDGVKDGQLAKRWPESVLGSEEFVQRHRQLVVVDKPPRVVEPRIAEALVDVVAAVAAVCKVEQSFIRTARPGVRNVARMLAIHIAATICCLPNAVVAEHFSLSAAHSVSTMSARCVKAIEGNRELTRTFEAVLERLGDRANVA